MVPAPIAQQPKTVFALMAATASDRVAARVAVIVPGVVVTGVVGLQVVPTMCQRATAGASQLMPATSRDAAAA
jgi:hypothetical protein